MAKLTITDTTAGTLLHTSQHPTLTQARMSTMSALKELQAERNNRGDVLGTRAHLLVLFSSQDGDNALNIAMSDGHKWRAEITEEKA